MVHKSFRRLIVCCLVVSSLSCQAREPRPIVLVKAFLDIAFNQPVDFQVTPADPQAFYIVEQQGIIYRVTQPQDKRVFLDIQPLVHAGHSEEGLLGLAFHPRHLDNGYFYVNYTAFDPRRTIIARFERDRKNPLQADPQSRLIILEIDQPYGNHNGGQIAFGPDGYLYIAVGDGGGAGDPHGHGQNPRTLLGSILRLDVDHPIEGKNYGIPQDNPFVGHPDGWREEIYAYGLRNPWRFSFDPLTGQLWAGDVGQDKPYEEVDIIEKGRNYGWNIMEGNHCFRPPQNCNQMGLTKPIWEYSVEDGRSITGGFVYRGQGIPELFGAYIYGDFVSGRLWALRYDGKNADNKLIWHDPNLYVSSFGVDLQNEIYLCSFDGNIYKLANAKMRKGNF